MTKQQIMDRCNEDCKLAKNWVEIAKIQREAKKKLREIGEWR